MELNDLEEKEGLSKDSKLLKDFQNGSSTIKLINYYIDKFANNYVINHADISKNCLNMILV
jgi:hypothetical protein